MPGTKPPTNTDDIEKVKVLITLSETGRRIGECHHRVTLTNAQVDQCFGLQEDGWGSRRIAKFMGASRSCIQDILACRTRAQLVAKQKTIIITRPRKQTE